MERSASTTQQKILSVAPMLDWTDRHCRAFLRLVCPSCVLYTEMITTPAILRGRDPQRYLEFSPSENPLVLQLGGDDSESMARAAGIARNYGYSGLNLNVGCPSPRVQKGRFGACLMHEPGLVRELLDALASAGLPVSVKHRLGLDREEDYEALARFVATVSEGACQHFIVHARNAWLKGLNPAENREVPPLRWDWVSRLKQDFPQLQVELNGGLRRVEDVLSVWPGVDGVMIGRAAYHSPFFLAELELALGRREALPSMTEVWEGLLAYAAAWGDALPAPRLTRHLHGLYYGHPGAKSWRRLLGTVTPAETAVAALQRLQTELSSWRQLAVVEAVG
ncbi:tRNA dihydrouridine(20/20a) synthase DusA [Acidithiobacillus sp. AMEEHan]|uniref:tRNA dihydrouridine(20/20a) synthase DusA n=1 Tax=Acidithiobacillus sp. AMEEHan TaxID=2994951 RepID=UPI0027E499E0|nr:tRNA dihydrouridine(20/20a) synthase DusA [Acidithiobacillus sp. AMEEHan]